MFSYMHALELLGFYLQRFTAIYPIKYLLNRIISVCSGCASFIGVEIMEEIKLI